MSNKVSHTAAWNAAAQDLHADALGLIAVNPEDSGYGTVNAPANSGWGVCLSFLYENVRNLLLLDNRGGVWVQSYDGLSWNEWRRLATATPPQEYDLPLADGIVARDSGCKYSKTQNNICTMSISCEKSTDGLLPEMTIATLPEGYRPAHYTESTAYAATSDYSAYPAAIRIWENGEIKIWFQAESAKYFIAQVTFLAE